ncbi:MAG: hypothetical protein DSY80_00495, partial [Desulfocapsa sp.]
MGRPGILLNLGENSTLQVTTLVDTGASISVLSESLVQEYYTSRKLPPLIQASTITAQSATGHSLCLLGQVDIQVPSVGLATFQVIKGIKETGSHQCILGYDNLDKFGFTLDKKQLIWGDQVYPVQKYSLGISLQIMEHDPELESLLNEFQSLFGEAGSLPAARVPAMTMGITGGPIHQRPYRTALSKREEIDKELDAMLELGVIRPSGSPWGSPITIVPKKDGTLRFCIDYRRVNDITVKDRYPLTYIQDIFDHLQGATIFSTLDCRSGYWQVNMAEQDIPKTAFVCHRGQFEWLRMPFGLSNAPSHYQRCMNQVLAKHIGKRVMVFLDDIVVYSPDRKTHLKDLKLVFEELREAGLTLKRKKCHFLKEEVELLGYIVSKQGITAQPQKTQAIRALAAPTSVSEIRSFMGMCSYYRQLVPNFAEKAEPILALTRKHATFKWTAHCQASFDQLKEDLCSTKVMAHPNPNKPYIVYTDACDYAIGGILCQEDDDGLERPIQYISAQLTSTQRKWATIEKEAYAVGYALNKLRCYLLGAEFVVYTDHKPLLSLFTKEMRNTKIQRWGILFAEFGVKIRFRPGRNNVRADMLSRIKEGTELALIDSSTEWVELDMTSSPPVLADDLDREGLSAAQQEEYPEEWKSALEPDTGYILHKGLLYSINKPTQWSAKFPRLILPKEYRNKVISACHEEAAHAGLLKTMLKVQGGYVWPGMKREIERTLKQCPHCLVHNSREEKVEMGEMPIAQSPGQVVSMDLIGPLVVSEQGNQYALVMIDHWSGWIEVYPLASKSNAAVWHKLRTEYFPRHGACRVLICDQGSEFKGKEF